MNLTDLETKVLKYMMTEKSHYVMPNDIKFLKNHAYYKVMSNLDKKGMVIRKSETYGTYSGFGNVVFVGYSITQYAIEYLT